MAMEFVWQFATTTDPRQTAWMDDVVLLLMPSINPDGQVMVIDWYEKHLGTQYEGGRMPWLYHHYVGHDNNRDFYMLTQNESQAVNDLLYQRWFPQVFVDEHQMGSTGPRMFVPPQTDPLALEVHSLIFRQADLIGTNMSYRLEEAGKTGVGHNMIFDSYWPGVGETTPADKVGRHQFARPGFTEIVAGCSLQGTDERANIIGWAALTDTGFVGGAHGLVRRLHQFLLPLGLVDLGLQLGNGFRVIG